MGVEVSVEGLTKSFGSQNIWRDVTLTLPEGEVSALLGPSGTGKSVFLKTLIGLLHPEQGSVIIDGTDITKCSARELYEIRKLFGVLFQDGALFSSLTVLENVKIVVETLGAKGVMIRTKTERVYVPAAQETRVVNPTGVGDAFRAGVLKGYFEGVSLEQMGKFGNISAVYAIEHAGATEHTFSIEEYMQRFNENYAHS